MPRLRFDPEFGPADTLRRLSADAEHRHAYQAIKRLLIDLRDETSSDPVQGTAFREIGDGLAYYRLVGSHPDVWAVIWRRLDDGSIAIIYIGDEYV